MRKKNNNLCLEFAKVTFLESRKRELIIQIAVIQIDSVQKKKSSRTPT